MAPVAKDAAEPPGGTAIVEETKYLSLLFPDLWGYGLTREQLYAMADVPTGGYT